MTEIDTVEEYRRAVRRARRVYCRPQFGVTERWVRISKCDALSLVRGYGGALTGEDLEVYGGVLATIDEETGEMSVG